MVGKKFVVWNRDTQGIEEMLHTMEEDFYSIWCDRMNWVLTKRYKSLGGDRKVQEFGTIYNDLIASPFKEKDAHEQFRLLEQHIRKSIEGYYNIDLTFIYIPTKEKCKCESN